LQKALAHLLFVCIITVSNQPNNEDKNMNRQATSYDYPMTGNGAETVAHLTNGTTVTVDKQYKAIMPHKHLSSDCDMMTKMGGRCNCGALDGIDAAALIAEAREFGFFGNKPAIKIERVALPEAPRYGYCHKCGSCCYGDCSAN
jgi:hypothetical protein